MRLFFGALLVTILGIAIVTAVGSALCIIWAFVYGWPPEDQITVCLVAIMSCVVGVVALQFAKAI